MRHDEFKNAEKPKVLKINEKGKYAEDHHICTWLRWDSPPQTKHGEAPSNTGRIMMKISGVPFVRFRLEDGELGEPLEILPNQPCKAFVVD